MRLQSFEQGVERMVGGVFQRAFKSSVRPIQIGRRLIREIDARRTVDASGKPVAPNVFVVHLNEKDRSAFGDLEKPLIAELVEAAKQYASDEEYGLAGDVRVSLLTDATMKPGRFEVHGEVKVAAAEAAAPVVEVPAPVVEVPSAVVPSVPVVPVAPVVPMSVEPPGVPTIPPSSITPPTIATPSIPPVPMPSSGAPAPVLAPKAVLVLGNGTRLALRPGVVSVGRSADSTLPLNDTNVSRKHAELRSRGEGSSFVWVLVDLGSTNGTLINGVKVSGEQVLKNGDNLLFGNTTARFEVA